MNLLFLGPEKRPQIAIIDFLSNDGNSITSCEEKLNMEDITKTGYDFLISFSYRYIIRNNILNYFKDKAINLHISYLPWNKGADPNLWSILENTPQGVTIHQMDYKLDAGKILYQKEMGLIYEPEQEAAVLEWKTGLKVVEVGGVAFS